MIFGGFHVKSTRFHEIQRISHRNSHFARKWGLGLSPYIGLSYIHTKDQKTKHLNGVYHPNMYSIAFVITPLFFCGVCVLFKTYKNISASFQLQIGNNSTDSVSTYSQHRLIWPKNIWRFSAGCQINGVNGVCPEEMAGWLNYQWFNEAVLTTSHEKTNLSPFM